MSKLNKWCTAISGSGDLTIENGSIAPQAHGSVLLRLGKSVLLVTATSNRSPSAHLDFFPLTVEYREKMAAAGRIPGSFLRREARPGDHEVIGSRLVDRTIRPFFPDGYRCETQLLATVMSCDPAIDTTVFAITGASMALMISDIPWSGPVVGIRIAWLEDRYHLFPTPTERAKATMDLVISVSRQGLVMVEGRADEVSEDILLGAFDAAREGAEPLLALQEQMAKEVGDDKRDFTPPEIDQTSLEMAATLVVSEADTLFGAPDKITRHQAEEAIVASVTSQLLAEAIKEHPAETEIEDLESSLKRIASLSLKQEIRRRTLSGQRLDGRSPTDIRQITGEVAWLPSTHGSSIFTRGETQALVSCTLGTAENEQLIEDLSGLRKESFLLHYNFPSYSVGEVRPLRGPGRREIGHGTLAKRAIEPVLPDNESYPFTIRLESEISSSNGSSSMATVCGGILALMDAGVPIRQPVAGVAMGLISEGGQTVVLSDILGDEDHLGDMDFKITGTTEGITAVQMDNKIGSLPREVMAQALRQAREGRLQILSEMKSICQEVRPEPPAQAPRVSFLRIRPTRIRDLIGPGGKNIKGIEQDNGVKLNVDQDGSVKIYGPPGARLKEATKRINYLTGEPRVGGIYRGRVTGVRDFGCFVEIFYGIEGLVHVSELAAERIGSATEVATEGEEMIVKVMGTTTDGKLELSRQAAIGEELS